ncbi:hypothetical protein AMJ86_01500 [bacterium SM23_57]|jgi:hypothetical protein|nr:MAG: hypothetical protein AMJ86_01500 [bacterium SM23_57]
MDSLIIDKITFHPDYEKIAKELKIKPGSSRASNLNQLIDKAASIARPKAMYKIVTVEVLPGEQVLLDKQPFYSRILCINLRDVHRAFPYIITSGIELYQWKNTIEDPFTGYLADTITSYALLEARERLMSHLSDQYGLRKITTMNPGSLEDWPLQAQTPLFALLGDPREAIGVYLTASLLMIPRHTVSGILFETDTDFVNCQLCPRGNCTHRRVPFDPEKRSQYLSA